MDVLSSVALLGAFIASAAFLLTVPSGRARPKREAGREAARPLIAPPPDWKR